MPVSISQVVSVVLALAVVYYILGLIVSVLTKAILEAFDTRGKSLEEFLKKNLLGATQDGKSTLLEQLKNMPQINSLKPVRYAKKFHLPVGVFSGKTEIINYVERIPPKNLVDALFDLKGTAAAGEEKIKEVIELLPDKFVTPTGEEVEITAKAELKKFIEAKFSDVEAFRSKMETWFTGMMDQAAQEYKAQARRWVIFLSLLVTFIFGVDSISLAKLYWQNSALTATADAYASAITASSDAENIKSAKMDALIKQMDAMQATDQFWYKKPKDAPANWLWIKILGMLITTLAVAQGSSFWYDIIKQIKGEQTKSATAGDAVEASAVRR